MRLLLIEDEQSLAHNIQKLLQKQTFAVDLAYTGREGLKKAEIEDYDLIILDWMLPDIEGIDVLKKLRESDIHIPVLLLTSRGEIEDKLSAFDLGCDDYLVKPFEFQELHARIKALLRREKQDIAPDLIIIQDLTIDRKSMKVKRKDIEIILSSKEYSVLEYLALHLNCVVDRMTLLTKIWDENADPFSRTVDVHIRYLRKKIDDDFEHKLIKTIPNKGYMLCEK
ncbi:response regulator transcription factor [Candidatus Dojkabacteria bacterium]|nr:response regulator transcription factor [Candidatus Dojkabacteria bacterium]